MEMDLLIVLSQGLKDQDDRAFLCLLYHLSDITPLVNKKMSLINLVSFGARPCVPLSKVSDKACGKGSECNAGFIKNFFVGLYLY
jgi:hypothetical protein